MTAGYVSYTMKVYVILLLLPLCSISEVLSKTEKWREMEMERERKRGEKGEGGGGWGGDTSLEPMQLVREPIEKLGMSCWVQNSRAQIKMTFLNKTTSNMGRQRKPHLGWQLRALST